MQGWKNNPRVTCECRAGCCPTGTNKPSSFSSGSSSLSAFPAVLNALLA
jgi:hypothetical protein